MTKERPIIFSAPMVRAILAGKKTQTRRVVRPQPEDYEGGCSPRNKPKHLEPYIDAYCSAKRTSDNPRGMGGHWCWWTEDDRQGPGWWRCPYGVPGDQLWVKETWGTEDQLDDLPPRDITAHEVVLWYRADLGPTERGHGEPLGKWRSPRFMPRWASRLTLEVKAVRVERVQEITQKDIIAEGVLESWGIERIAGIEIWQGKGVDGKLHYSPFGCFAVLWDSINAKRGYSWESNPWVWVIEFETVS